MVERYKTKGCCGTTSLSVKIDQTLSKDFLPLLREAGFTEAQHFTKAGLLYVENEYMVISGSFGQTLLQIKCKKACDDSLNDFEKLLTTWSKNAGDQEEKKKSES
jgi:hypothetical protein